MAPISDAALVVIPVRTALATSIGALPGRKCLAVVLLSANSASEAGIGSVGTLGSVTTLEGVEGGSFIGAGPAGCS